MLAELARACEPNERRALVEPIAAEAKLLGVWRSSAPCNYASRHHLVLAELAALQGETALAMQRYDQAIAGAQESGFAQVDAVADEASGRYHLAEGRVTIARAYLKEAAHACQRWGAAANAEQLTIAHPWLHGEGRNVGKFLELGATDCSTHVDATSPFRTPRFAGGLDVAMAIRATEALATELVLDRVIERLMRTLLENTGNGTAGEISRAGIAES